MNAIAVHVRQLVRRTGFDPDLGRAINSLAGQGLLPATMRAAHDRLTRALVTLRLLAPGSVVPDAATRTRVVDALGLADWDAVVAALDATRAAVQDLGEVSDG